jgi:competence protein ComEC
MWTVYLKTCIDRLKNTSVYKHFLNNIFPIALFVLLVLLTLINRVSFPLVLLFAIYLFRSDKYLFILGLIFSSLLFISFLILEITIKPDADVHFSGLVIDLKQTEKYQKITVRSGIDKNIVFDYDFLDLHVGDIVQGDGEILTADPARIEGGFDYRQYLKNQRITKVIRSERIKITGHRFVLGSVKAAFLNYLESHFNGQALIFLKAMIIGEDEGFTDEFREAVTDNGILHLFAVSGLHIILFVEIITKILQFFHFRENIINLTITIFLFVYLVITGFAASVLRAALMYELGVVNKYLKLGFSSVDIISFCFLLLIIINPYYAYDLGFILSFIASLVIIFTSPHLSKHRHFLQLFIITCMVTLFTLPIVININNEINILSPLTNIVFIDLIEGMILPFSLIILCLPFLATIYEYVIISFSKLTIWIGRICYLPLRLPDFSFLSGLLYYILLFLTGIFSQQPTRRRLCSIVLVFFLIILAMRNTFTFSGEVVFLDLVNGEATLIKEPFDRCNILIDTGDGTNSAVTDYLKSRGIFRLDYLILTHNHLDHNGEALRISDEINVKNQVISAYDSSETSKKTKIIRVKSGDVLTCGNLELLILHPDQRYKNENDNSIVFYAKIGPKGFLFLGDVSKEIEEKFVGLTFPVAVIKIAHHGSSTSTSPLLLSSLRPEYAVIQTGRIEKFGFPNRGTIATLEEYGIKVYRTDLDYSITYRYKKKESIFKTLK